MVFQCPGLPPLIRSKIPEFIHEPQQNLHVSYMSKAFTKDKDDKCQNVLPKPF